MRFAGMQRAFAFPVASAVLIAAGAVSPAAAAEFKVDAVHSAVMFRVKHLDVSYSFGRFNHISGSFALDDGNAAASKLSIEVKTESIDTGSTKRDDHLRGPDFFNAKQFPTISFVGKEFKKSAGPAWEVTGDLTLHGVTKSITVKVDPTGTAKDPFGSGQRSGIMATFDIKRSDYGMKFMIDKLGDDVKLMVSIEGVQG